MLQKLVNFMFRTLGTPGEHHLMQAGPKTKKVPFEQRLRDRKKKGRQWQENTAGARKSPAT